MRVIAKRDCALPHKARHKQLNLDGSTAPSALSGLDWDDSDSNEAEQLSAANFVGILREHVGHIVTARDLPQCDSAVFTKAWSHKSFTSRWRIRPSPLVDANALADEESVDNSKLASTTISRSIDCKPSPRDAPSAALYSSASADEIATTFCGRPRSPRVPTHRHLTTRRRPPCPQTASITVREHLHFYSLLFFLPRVLLFNTFHAQVEPCKILNLREMGGFKASHVPADFFGGVLYRKIVLTNEIQSCCQHPVGLAFLNVQLLRVCGVLHVVIFISFFLSTSLNFRPCQRNQSPSFCDVRLLPK